ncbi:MAG: radical SAM protein [Pseudomonadota bacterium]
MNYIFGPVPSRRLGFSLGIDIIPFKTCSLDCVYCQLGKTTCRTLKRKEWIRPESVLKELKKVLSEKKQIDFITFSGSGEPTLNASLGQMINDIKKICSIPVAVLTNSTLLYLPEVRKDLKEADLVVPSLDAVTPAVFNAINRPHADLKLETIIEGIKAFGQEFAGTLWLEVMIVKGINDTRDEFERIEKVIRQCRAHKIQINTVTRPPAEEAVEPADKAALQLARSIFGEQADLIEEFQKEKSTAEQAELHEKIIELVRRHPDSCHHIGLCLGVSDAVAEEQLSGLLTENKIIEIIHEGKKFYKVA